MVPLPSAQREEGQFLGTADARNGAVLKRVAKCVKKAFICRGE